MKRSSGRPSVCLGNGMEIISRETYPENVNNVDVAFLFGLSYEEIIWKT
jgi:hypothetical protein